MALLLAITLHPVAMLMAEAVQSLYPINEQFVLQMAEIKKVIASAPSIWHILALLALTPAICEELAFRGFILSGLRHMGSKWGAILLSSLFFGVTHGILQQSISAAFVGMVIGYLAVQTGSLLPCFAFHVTYNALSLSAYFGLASSVGTSRWLGWLAEVNGEVITYRWPAVVIGALLAAAILAWFRKLPHTATPEEELHRALSHQSARATAS